MLLMRYLPPPAAAYILPLPTFLFPTTYLSRPHNSTYDHITLVSSKDNNNITLPTHLVINNNNKPT